MHGFARVQVRTGFAHTHACLRAGTMLLGCTMLLACKNVARVRDVACMQLFVVGGHSADDVVLSEVECYVPAADKWLPCAPLGCARSGLALCAV